LDPKKAKRRAPIATRKTEGETNEEEEHMLWTLSEMVPIVRRFEQELPKVWLVQVPQLESEHEPRATVPLLLHEIEPLL